MDLKIKQQQLSSDVVVLLLITDKKTTGHHKTTKKTNTTATTTTTATPKTKAAVRTLIMGACMGRCLSNDKQNSCLRSNRRHSTDEQEIKLMPNEDKRKREKLIFRIIKFKRKQKRKHFIDKFWETQESNNCSGLNRANDGESDIQLQNLDVQTLLLTASEPKESTISFINSGAVISSRASSSLDLEWEHEYGKFSVTPNIRKDRINQEQTEAWRFLSQSTINDETEENQLLDIAVEKLNCLPSPTPQLAIDCDKKTKSIVPTVSINDISKTLGKNLSPTRRVGSKGFPENYNGGGHVIRTTSHNSWSHISTPESLEWDIDEDQQNQLRVEDDNLDHDTLELLHQIEMLKNQVLHETGDGLLDGGIKELAFEGIANGDS